MPVLVAYPDGHWRDPAGTDYGAWSADPGDDSPVELETYVYKNASNTGLAAVGLTESNLTAYGGPSGYQGTQTLLIENKVINSELRLYDSVHITLRRCKVNGNIDCDSATAGFTAEDCDIDAANFTAAATGFRNLIFRRCNISGGITSINAANDVLIEDCYTHGQYVEPEGETHTGAIACFGGSNITIRRTTIYNDSVDNGFGGGPSGAFNLYGDNSYILNVLVEYCYIPAQEGGYAASLGYNPGGKPYGDNTTGIVFRHNIFGKGGNGKGGAFGTVTSWLDDQNDGVTGTGNLFYDNIWQDGSGAITPNVG